MKETIKAYMKNILAENLLRFGAKNLTETDRSKLAEQATEPTDSGKSNITGTHAKSLMTVPGISITPSKSDPNRSFLKSDGLWKTMIEYIGGYQGNLNKIIGKTILVFAKKLALWDPKSGAAAGGSGFLELENNNTDKIIVGSFMTRACYVGHYGSVTNNADLKSGTTYLYLFNRPVTTNYSGDPNKPFIQSDGTASESADRTIEQQSDLFVARGAGPTADSALASSDDPTVIPKSLRINGSKLKAGVDYIRIRLGDGYCPEYKGYADYIEVLTWHYGEMVNVNKIK